MHTTKLNAHFFTFILPVFHQKLIPNLVELKICIKNSKKAYMLQYFPPLEFNTHFFAFILQLNHI